MTLRSQVRYSVCVAAAVALVSVAPANDPAPTIDTLVSKALSAWDVPGVAVVVVTRDGIKSLKGYGTCQLGDNQPVTADTVFPLASCTKAVTTTLLAMLADEGKVAWDDPVRKHWPDFHLADPLADAQVTLRDLLTHRTGVASHDYLWYRSPLPMSELVQRVGKLPLERSFRSTFQYQSVMYTAAGLAGGRAAGSFWDDLVRERVFRRLGMRAARTTTPTLAEVPDQASPHRADRAGRFRVIPRYVQSEPNPAGSIHASARDLVGFLQLHLTGGTFQGERLVSTANLSETHTPQVALRLEGAVAAANPDTLQMSYGLGWVIQDYRGRLLVSHAGTIDGFRAHLTLLPRDGFALGILANRHHTRMNLALSNMLVDHLLELPRKDWHGHFRALVRQEEEFARAAKERRDRERRRDLAPSRPMSDYAGTYEHPAYGRAEVVHQNGRLAWTWSGFRGLLTHYGTDTFEADDENLTDPLIAFAVTPADGVVGFTLFNLLFRRVNSSG